MVSNPGAWTGLGGNSAVLILVDAWKCPLFAGIQWYRSFFVNRQLVAGETLLLFAVNGGDDDPMPVPGSVKMGQPIDHPQRTLTLGASRLLNGGTKKQVWTDVGFLPVPALYTKFVVVLSYPAGLRIISPILTDAQLPQRPRNGSNCYSAYSSYR